MNWHVLRSEESRGFVSRRIFQKIIEVQMIIWGTCFYEQYEGVRRVLSPEEIFDLNTKQPEE
jgi:hypothetical protein